jgi:hypothetical protein
MPLRGTPTNPENKPALGNLPGNALWKSKMGKDVPERRMGSFKSHKDLLSTLVNENPMLYHVQ